MYITLMCTQQDPLMYIKTAIKLRYFLVFIYILPQKLSPWVPPPSECPIYKTTSTVHRGHPQHIHKDQTLVLRKSYQKEKKSRNIQDQ